MNLAILKCLNDVPFAHDLRILTSQRIHDLFPIWFSLLDNATCSVTRSNRRWAAECLRDNGILYEASIEVLK